MGIIKKIKRNERPGKWPAGALRNQGGTVREYHLLQCSSVLQEGMSDKLDPFGSRNWRSKLRVEGSVGVVRMMTRDKT